MGIININEKVTRVPLTLLRIQDMASTKMFLVCVLLVSLNVVYGGVPSNLCTGCHDLGSCLASHDLTNCACNPHLGNTADFCFGIWHMTGVMPTCCNSLVSR